MALLYIPLWNGAPESASRSEGAYNQGHQQWPRSVLSSVEEEVLPPLAQSPRNHLDRVRAKPTLCGKVHFILRI